mmetsp:Transcript_125668/g.391306  ORF Transcript_125668/g.391306 Transcript_125668/m.391306 type:complete len:889 (-) Transcript_125668:155-2821(-)
MAKVAPIDHVDCESSAIRLSGTTSSPDDQSTTRKPRWSVMPLPPVSRTARGENAYLAAIRRFLHSRLFTVIALVALIIALFLRDIFVVCQVATNTELDVILTLVFILFAMEFIGLSISEASYPLGFFFWMDIVGTLSMIFDISYMLGSDATQSVRVGESSKGENFILVRAARAAKLGARAGRLSRVLKILRFLPFITSGDKVNEMARVKMAKVISRQLTNILSTRVALQAITLVVVLPLFQIFQYPEVDDSMSVWAEVLSRNAEEYRTASVTGNAYGAAAALAKMDGQLRDCWDFYSEMSYGPWSACYGQLVTSGDGSSEFVCDPLALPVTYQFPLPRPGRKASIWEVRHNNFQVFFDLSTPRKEEAAAAIGLVWFIVVIMCIFGLVMSSSISVIALQPLERMLSVVRQRCGEIFKYADDLHVMESSKNDEETSEMDDDVEQVSEFKLLEKVVSKLAAIAHISSANNELEIKEDMNENELIMLNWMQGTQVRTDNGGTVVEVREAEPMKEEGGSIRGFLGSARAPAHLPREALETLTTDDFDTLELSKECGISIATYIITSSQGSSAWVHSNIIDSKLLRFVAAVEGKYKDNPFHNFAHGVDVLHTVAQFFSLVNSEGFISETMQFWMMIAAIAHDVGHIGVNNAYLVETSHELALKYNDRSPMENMHCALLFKLASEPEADIFSQIEKPLYKEMRKGIISVILHTDMAKHNDMVKELGVLYQMSSDAFDALSPGAAVSGSATHLQLCLSALMHSADVNNPTKPWDLCKKLAYRCLEEFFAQGDLERAAGIPIQMLNDRDKVNQPNSQVGFIEFVITPLVEVIVSLFPQLDAIALRLGQNAQNWAQIWQEESNPSPDAAGKVNARVQRVSARCSAVMREIRSPELCTL